MTRLCYCGSVLHTRPRGLTATREPIQIGAEIYGHAGIESDVEIQRLLRAALAACGDRRRAPGHRSRRRVPRDRAPAGASPELESELLEALLAKDRPGIGALSETLDAATRDALRTLPDLVRRRGGARRGSAAAARIIPSSLRRSRICARSCRRTGIAMSIDLADLRGYHYHSGVVFAAYCERLPSAIALGGRYDEVGKAFGRARPATGFSMDLREIARVAPRAAAAGAILAPHSADAGCSAAVEALRDRGRNA